MLHPVSSTIPGKLRQIWEAWRVGAGMSKDEILAAYVNRLPMGGNIYGVEAASRTYFGIPAAELNLARASLLAAIPNDPSYLNPYEHWKALKTRQAYVLERMVARGDVTQVQADRAVAEQIYLQPRRHGIVAAPHFLFWLAQRVPPGTAHVRTTIDRPLQQFAETQVQQVIGELAPRNVHHASVVVIDNHTGEVLAYVGSPDYFSDIHKGRNDGVQALRQPGSTLKPFLYQYALELRAIHPNTILADVPAHYAIPGGLLYSPSDYSSTFQGPVRVRIALADSLNVPAIRVLERVGVPRFLTRLHELGFAHLDKAPDFYGLGLTLGGGEVSLWELAHAYVTSAREGAVTPLVTRLDDGTAKADAPTRIGERVDWQLVTDIISDNHARAKSFGVASVLAMPFPAAVKTGTSSDFRDTWTVGYTSDYTVAVWVGNFDGEPMRRVSGVAGAAPLWNRIMLHLHESREPAPFPAPEEMVRRPICATTGLRPTPACGAAIVYEYLFPRDLVQYEDRLQRRLLPPEYDEWLAAQHQSVAAAQGFKILTPHQGDLYLVYPAAFAKPQAQRLKFQAVATPGRPVEWRLNGRVLASTSPDSVFWSLRAGRWTLEARSGQYDDKVTFDVEPAQPHAGTRGFSLAR
jgi:penicillin-binding protein 1C